MSANHLQTLSDNALNGAIRDLSLNGQWATRLRQLLVERDKRKNRTKR